MCWKAKRGWFRSSVKRKRREDKLRRQRQRNDAVIQQTNPWAPKNGLFVIMRVIVEQGKRTGLVVLKVEAGARPRLPGRVLDSHETVGRPILTGILQKQGVSKGTFDCASRKRVRVLWVADQKLSTFLIVPIHESHSRCQPGSLRTLLRKG